MKINKYRVYQVAAIAFFFGLGWIYTSLQKNIDPVIGVIAIISALPIAALGYILED